MRAEIVEGNAKRGRDIASGIPDREFNQILKLFGNNIDKQFRSKLKNEVIMVGR